MTTSEVVQYLLESISASQDFFKTVSIAVGAGASRYLNEYLKSDDFHWKKFLAHVVISGFSGWFFSYVVADIAPKWTLFAAGVAGFAGTQAFDLAIHLSYKYLGKLKPVGSEPDRVEDTTTTKE